MSEPVSVVDWTSPQLSNVVVVGTSLAGLRAVEALRRQGYTGSLTWIGEESAPPYDRPPLSKQLLLGTFEPEQILLRRKQGFDGLQVTMRLGTRVEALAADRDRLRLSDGSTVDFDGLVIATGARARALSCPGSGTGVFELRTLDDALALRSALTGGAPRVAVVGGGFIGLEAASVCRTLGLPVTVVEMAPVPLGRVIGDEMGQAVTDLHRAHGVEFRTGVRVSELLGRSTVSGLGLSDGSEVAADIVIVGIGVQPNTEWLADSRVALGDGVECDSRCATTRPRVVACGDVARFYNERFAAYQRIEHWTHAGEMASAAVARLLEGPQVEPFTPVPYFWSDQFDVKLQCVGRIEAGVKPVYLEGSPAERKCAVAFAKSGRLTAALTWNSPAKLIRLRRAIGEGMDLDQARAL